MNAGSVARAPGAGLAGWSSVVRGGERNVLPSAPQTQRAASSSRQRTSLHIVARDRQRRLLSYVLSTPTRVERYFEASIWRRWLWAGISLGAGFYAGNIVSLSFGALAINDVFAAVITVLFYEVVTHLYYTSEKPALRLWFANCFKMGVTASLLADAAKLGS